MVNLVSRDDLKDCAGGERWLRPRRRKFSDESDSNYHVQSVFLPDSFVEHTISRRAFKLSCSNESNVSAELYRYSAFNVARTSIALFCLSPTSAVNFRDI